VRKSTTDKVRQSRRVGKLGDGAARLASGESPEKMAELAPMRLCLL